MNNSQKLIFILLLGLIAGFFVGRWSVRQHETIASNKTEIPSPSAPAISSKKSTRTTQGHIPQEALDVLHYVRQHHEAPDNYVGGREFKNRERRLPNQTEQGKKIHYQEWDIYPKQKNKNRGPERLITGDDESARYTADHYQTFISIHE
ncbi:MAG TPA: ribonuclease domain-containing protein [Chitinophagaceae bacterium]|nr:ribonuclease domain-containing protein [Chitinophagaceae bacterium]